MDYKFYSWAAFSLSALLAFSACANDDIANSENEVTLNGHKLNITINEETFEAEKPTRAAQVLYRDTVDMGDGLVAEVSVEPDKEEPLPAKTRAAMSEGHYTIYAVDAAGNRVADELSGTVASGKFVPDANKRIRLAPGTYTFVCHNDEVKKTPTGLEVSDYMKTYPMIGTVTKTLSGGVETVTFHMKHLAARFRAQITTYTAYAKMLEGSTTYFFVPGGVLSTMHLDKKGQLTSRELGMTAYTWDTLDKFKHVGNKPFSSIVEPFEVINSQYTYIALAEGENIPANKMDYLFYGSFHGKVAQRSITIKTPLLRNHTYLVKAKIKTKDPLYLYQDGTVGYLGDKEAGKREPIAVVVTEKTATEKGMAVALKEATSQHMMVQDMYSGPFRFYNDVGTTNNMDGYKLTYSTDYYNSAAFTARGQQVPTVPPSEAIEPYSTLPVSVTMYSAAHYKPAGVTTLGANIGKWFLPSAGQMNLVFKRYAKLKESDIPTSFTTLPPYPYTTAVNIQGDALNKAFTDAGGDVFQGKLALSGTNGQNPPSNYPVYIFATSNKIAWVVNNQLIYMNGLNCHPFVFF